MATSVEISLKHSTEKFVRLICDRFLGCDRNSYLADAVEAALELRSLQSIRANGKKYDLAQIAADARQCQDFMSEAINIVKSAKHFHEELKCKPEAEREQMEQKQIEEKYWLDEEMRKRFEELLRKRDEYKEKVENLKLKAIKQKEPKGRREKKNLNQSDDDGGSKRRKFLSESTISSSDSKS